MKTIKTLMSILFFITFCITTTKVKAQFGTSPWTPTSGTYTVPAGVTSITVECWGGGGGSGGAKSSSGTDAASGGGGGGAYSVTTISVVAGQSIIVAVGAGGSSGSNSGGNGGAGGNSSITYNSSLVAWAAGGSGGNGSTVGNGAGGNGGSTGTGTIYNGGKGGNGYVGGSFDFGGGGGGGAGSTSNGGNGTTSTGSPVSNPPGGTGGASGGGNGGNGYYGLGGSGSSGSAFGGGGGGAGAYNGGSGSGGAGAVGSVKITYVACAAPSGTVSPSSVNICNGGTTNFSITASGNAPITYQWQSMASNCASPTNVGTNSSSFTTASLLPGTYYYNCYMSNACGNVSSLCATVLVSSAVPSTPGTISGSATQCSGASGQVYSISPVAEAVSYNWTVPTGWTITSGANTTAITVTSGTLSGNISVTASNVCGTSAPSTFAVTAFATPIATASSNGPVCFGTPLNLTGGPIGMSSYAWTGPNSYSNGTQSPTVSANATAAMAGTYILTVVNSNNCSGIASVPVTINTSPAVPTGWTGAANPVVGSSQTYSVTNVAGVTYTWVVPSGWTITAGQGTNSITVTVGLMGGNITVTPANSCGNGTTYSSAVTVNLSIIITTGTTWTCPAGVTSINVECRGGGGGGGGASTTNGAAGGGAGGSYSKVSNITVVPNNTYPYTVGTGGTAGSTAGTSGGIGGTSTFNTSTVIAVGGTGGTGATTAAAYAGGTGTTTGNSVGINFPGGNGASGIVSSIGGGGGGGAGSTASGGNGGTSGAGSAAGAGGVSGGGIGGTGTSNANGIAGTLPGGGARKTTSSARAGGAGGAGQIIITVNVITSFLSANTLNSFGPVCINTTTAPNSFSISGTSLTTSNITVGALNGYTYSTTSNGTYTNSLSLSQPGGTYSQIIYVKFNPTAVQSYNGNIPVGGGGASSINVSAVGSGISLAAPAAISSNTPQCEGTGVTFTSNCTAGTCYWVNSANGTQTANSFTTYTTTSTPGTYNVWVRAYDGTCWSNAVTASGVVNPSVNLPVFSLNSTSSRCQGAGMVSYSATASNNTGLTYSLDAASLIGNNTININTGEVTYDAAWSGTSIITANAAGCNGPLTATHTVTINPIPLPPTGNPVQPFINSASVSNLLALGTDVKWYDVPTGGNLLLSTDALGSGNTYYASQTLSGCESQERLSVLAIISYIKFVNLHLFLEGLFDHTTNNSMLEAQDIDWGTGITFAKYGTGIADRIQVELYEGNPPFSSPIVNISGIDLSTGGLASFQIDPSHSGNYYIRIRTRNHLEVWSAYPVPFNATNVDFNFTASAINGYQAPGGIDPEVLVATGKYAFYLGDLDQSLSVDFDDFNVFEPFLTDGTYGFSIADFNGTGLVDFDDFNMFEPRLNDGPFAQYPGMVKK